MSTIKVDAASYTLGFDAGYEDGRAGCMNSRRDPVRHPPDQAVRKTAEDPRLVALDLGIAVLAYPGCPSAWRIKDEDLTVVKRPEPSSVPKKKSLARRGANLWNLVDGKTTMSDPAFWLPVPHGAIDLSQIVMISAFTHVPGSSSAHFNIRIKTCQDPLRIQLSQGASSAELFRQQVDAWINIHTALIKSWVAYIRERDGVH